MTFARILGITVATSVIVFLGLTFLLPRHHEEKAAAQGVTPDQVFGAQATPPAPGETPAAAPAAPSNPAAPAATTTASSETPTAPAPTEGGAPPAATPAADAAATAPAQQGLSEEEARKIAEDVGRKVATRVVEEKSSSAPAAESAPAAAPAPAPAPAPAEPAPSAPAAPAESAPSPSPAPSESASSGSGTTLTESDVRRIAAEEARRVYNQQGAHSSGGMPKKAKSKPVEAPPAAASEPAPSAAAAEPAPASPPAAKPSTPAKPHKAKATKAKDMPGDLPASDAISSWWPATDKQSADRLNLVYAGEAAFEKAVVLLFNNPVDASAAASHLQLFGADGKAVSGSWESGSNPRMLLFKNVKPGRYTVVLAPELADSSGKTLAAGLHGPVYVH